MIPLLKMTRVIYGYGVWTHGNTGIINQNLGGVGKLNIIFYNIQEKTQATRITNIRPAYTADR